MIKHLPIACALLMTWYNLSGQIPLDEKRVIFDEDNQALKLWNLSDSLFTPTKLEIDTVDLYMRNYFKNELINKESASRYSAYFRQYAGLVINGQKVVYVNASCKKEDDFTKILFAYQGGGRCRFQAKVNLPDKQVADFFYNEPK